MTMKLQKISAVIAACSLLCGICSTVANADEVDREGVMTFRASVSKQYIKASELANSDMTVQGNVFVDNYTGLTTFKLTLESSEPLVIQNGGFTTPAFFANLEGTSSIYAREKADGTPTNVCLYYNDNPNELPLPNASVANEGGSLLSFDVVIPKKTPAGVYQVGFKSGYATNSIGLKEYYCFATNTSGDTDFGLQAVEVIVEPNALLGDVNCDGIVDPVDATKVLQYYAGTMLGYEEEKLNQYFGTPYVHTALEAAQTIPDGIIDERDAIKILRYYAASMIDDDVDWATL